ncbi:hypothetical protein H6G54_23330 [Anabaena cylindrica FACHB-243]|uniref:Uncharacterized protein n=1 Tax=Anabaena cylindrica (strain ATCC 27899 / PCC 7122) TaxID=272123 RepID=K9ZJY2_ANACC|nr:MULTISPECIES: hypothetical protein [Anabaena]AFZ59079.1 hypothetical protein Anacy_3692 [Anabaena cylindrica PCC 7122]MBD2420582.1 hypothetical protein [Anabaena cylindrica FACHB-243]MBY5284447.1 hypothetical protein [Anabaena sp. CCAP 1446/1C]MBY5308988.1 hypothetical protein [Anabaena sp. CCAP 1446/1C]MCM2408540.1 hypothetical protein [Anabaena sp. CCAP 1446/1C]
MELPINTNLQILKNNVHSFSQSAQQLGKSFKETADYKTDQAINKITTTLDQAKGSLEDSWQTATQIKNTTSETIENVITHSVKDLITQHPTFLWILQILGWASNHPIITLVILLFIIAFTWSIFKGIIHLIETASWSILKIPFQLIQALFKTIFLSLNKFGNFQLAKITDTNENNYISVVTPDGITYQNKQQRLAEISHRLESIQKEQQQLLQEAANLIGSETIDI